MKPWIAGWMVAALVAAGASLVVADEKGDNAGDDTWLIVDGIDTQHELVVSTDECVRIRVEGIAGSTFAKPVIKGPASIVATYAVRQTKDGKTMIGADVREYIIKPTGKGAVAITTKVTSPIPGQDPLTKTFKFKVE